MTHAETILWGVLAIVGMAGSALCSGLETGAYCLNRIRLAVRAGRTPPDRAARILQHEIDNPERLIGSLLAGNNFFNYLGATGASALLAGWGYDDAAIVAINTAVLTPIFFVFCESLPKELFRAEADRLTYLFAPALTVLRVAATVTLILPLVRAVARWASRLTGGGGEEGLALDARDRLAAMLREGASQGALSEAQAGLADRALDFHRATVGDEMVPWAEVHALSEDWERLRVLQHLARHRHAWYPVVDRRGRVSGLLHFMQVYLRPDATIPQLAVPHTSLRPELPARNALDHISRGGAGLAIVERDGRPVGIVSPMDLVAPLIGDLPD